MKFGMNLLLWTDCPTVAEHGPLLEKLKTWGYDGVEFPTAEYGPMRRSARREFGHQRPRRRPRRVMR